MNTYVINLLRAYDVASEINLEQVQRSMVGKNADKFRLKRFNREMTIQEPPVVLNLGTQEYELNQKTYKINIWGKIWNYGAVTISYKIPVNCSTIQELSELVSHFEKETFFEVISSSLLKDIVSTIGAACKELSVWEEVEDYTIIQYISENGYRDLPSTITFDDIARLVEGEGNIKLSSQTLDQIKNSLYQYSDEDLIILDWSRAVIMGDHEEVDELSDIVEFAVCQLLEMRFYDDLLDKKLSSLYKDIKTKKNGFFSNQYAELAHEASLLFIELSDIIETVENSLKVIGDTYYAKIYRLATDRFHIRAWRSSISQKLQNLSNISSLFSSEINERRNQLMELIIVILIAIEVVPFVWNLITGAPGH